MVTVSRKRTGRPAHRHTARRPATPNRSEGASGTRRPEQQRKKLYMFLRPKAFVFGVSLAFGSELLAQPDSARQLQEVVIEQTRLTTYRPAAYTWQADSAQRVLMGVTSVADLLRRTGVGQLRFYGPSGLATPSLRGSGSNHTAVLWNGISLASPLNGQLDLSLLPAAFFDEATVEAGGAASLYGNGSVGGTIHLNNQARFNEGWALQSQVAVGSFGNFFQDAGVRWSGRRWHNSTKVFYTQAANDFPFQNTTVFPARQQTREHNAFRMYGWVHQTYWQLRPRHLIAFKWWSQASRYEVPNPITVPRPAQAIETNTVNRLLASWHFEHETWDVFAQAALLHHQLLFQDPGTDAFSLARSAIHQAEINYRLTPRVSATGGLNYTWEQGEAREIQMNPQRHRLAAFYAAKWKMSSRWQLNGSARVEQVNGITMPLAPAANLVWSATSVWQITASAARNYRIPTFNDLYWFGTVAVGNPDLQAEQSMSYDLVAKGTFAKRPGRMWRWQLSVFSNRVANWIFWMPTEQNVWTPDNLRRVWARGLEWQVLWQQRINTAWNGQIQGQYRFTNATNDEVYENRNANELGMQLPFTPQHEASTEWRLNCKTSSLQITHVLTGRQFTDGTNTDFLAVPTYQLTHLWLTRRFRAGAARWGVTAEVNNLFDVNYLARPGFPMPGRNYRLTVRFDFNPNKTE